MHVACRTTYSGGKRRKMPDTSLSIVQATFMWLFVLTYFEGVVRKTEWCKIQKKLSKRNFTFSTYTRLCSSASARLPSAYFRCASRSWIHSFSHTRAHRHTGACVCVCVCISGHVWWSLFRSGHVTLHSRCVVVVVVDCLTLARIRQKRKEKFFFLLLYASRIYACSHFTRTHLQL